VEGAEVLVDTLDRHEALGVGGQGLCGFFDEGERTRQLEGVEGGRMWRVFASSHGNKISRNKSSRNGERRT
jgi:hypothetical protein